MMTTTISSVRKSATCVLTLDQRRKRHQIFERIISFLEAKTIQRGGIKLPFILHSSTIVDLRQTGLTSFEIHEIEQQIFADAVYSRNTEVFQDVPSALYYELKKQKCEHLLFEARAVCIPDAIMNALICSELQKLYGLEDLKLCGIFVKTRGFDEYGRVCESLRIDLDARLGRRGFIVPKLQNGMIVGLQIFRHPHDEKPFFLKPRGNKI